MNIQSKRTIFSRVRERFRYGLAMQEVIDLLLRRFRIMVYPYFIVAEGLGEQTVPNYSDAPDFKIRQLREEDVNSIIEINIIKRSAEKITSQIRKHNCLGLFVEDRLAGTTWSRDDFLPIPNSKEYLVELEADEAYLFDAFISREFRGYRLAPLLRYQQYSELAKNGKHRCYSISLAFNRSTRRFKARLGAKEIELRLLLGFAGWRSIDFRLKKYIDCQNTPRFRSLVLEKNA